MVGRTALVNSVLASQTIYQCLKPLTLDPYPGYNYLHQQVREISYGWEI
jgi:hypothetical protein